MLACVLWLQRHPALHALACIKAWAALLRSTPCYLEARWEQYRMQPLHCVCMQVVAAAVRERHEVDPSGAIIVLKVGPVTAGAAVCSAGVDVSRPCVCVLYADAHDRHRPSASVTGCYLLHFAACPVTPGKYTCLLLGPKKRSWIASMHA